VVKVGPYFLTVGMVEQEMKNDSRPLTPDVDALKSYVEKGGANDNDDVPEAIEAIDIDEKKDTADETTGLLKESVSSGIGGLSRGPSTLSDKTKQYLKVINLSVTNSDGQAVLYMGANPNGPVQHDYKVSWTANHLPTDSSGQVCVHTILAEQRRKGNGGFGLKGWIPDDVEEFHVDSCCKCVCCIGYAVVEGGAIDAIDSAAFPNVSSEENQEDADIKGLNHTSTNNSGSRSVASNSRTVEKVMEGEHTVESIIRALDELNASKTKFYRYLGFALMFFGFQFAMDPFPAIFRFIPWIGGAVGFIVYIAVFIVALSLACFGSITTISIAWLRYRPLWGILGITVSGAIAFFICTYDPH